MYSWSLGYIRALQSQYRNSFVDITISQLCNDRQRRNVISNICIYPQYPLIVVIMFCVTFFGIHFICINDISQPNTPELLHWITTFVSTIGYWFYVSFFKTMHCAECFFFYRTFHASLQQFSSPTYTIFPVLIKSNKVGLLMFCHSMALWITFLKKYKYKVEKTFLNDICIL